MPNYKTPGVFIEEISKFPPSVAPVETAIPAFIGKTSIEQDEPVRITSMLEYEQFFGKPMVNSFVVNVTKTNGQFTVEFEGTKPTQPPDFTYYSLQLFYTNGGGPCYVVSVIDSGGNDEGADFITAINKLEAFDEPTLLVFPDACNIADNGQYQNVLGEALDHCEKMGDRFTIFDVKDAVPTSGVTNIEIADNFRDKVPSILSKVKYGAAYYPYLHTTISFYLGVGEGDESDTEKIDAHITVNSYTDDGADIIPSPGATIDDPSIKENLTDVYDAARRFAAAQTVTLPPSGAIAGVYAHTDTTRGVWKAPANVSLAAIIEPKIKITDDLNGLLNVQPGPGKSVNAIRAFTGKGTLVWGARTLAGNDNENRYVPVRRFLIFAEESIGKACEFFVFEPNDPNTWVKVRTMIEGFLTNQWRAGALVGAKSEHAFYVHVGLNKTMTAQDVLDGLMIVEIGLAIARPAEFVILRFAQKMQES